LTGNFKGWALATALLSELVTAPLCGLRKKHILIIGTKSTADSDVSNSLLGALI
jgi:hypothetical protein